MTPPQTSPLPNRQYSPSAYRAAVSLLKRAIHRIARLTVSSDTAWHTLAGSVIRGSQFLCAVRDAHTVERIVKDSRSLHEILSRNHVITGPFEGLDYNGIRSFCSSLYPKLLGTYEHELESVVKAAIDEAYDLVVDVGAADGYYAVGFAFKNPKTQVIAFEQDPRARVQLANLAQINGVSEQLTIKGRCDPSNLLELPPARGLMIVDCEGFEEQLLGAEAISHLKNWDFIIETHDGYHQGITARLAQRFAATHRVQWIEAVHDLNKASFIDLHILKDVPREQIDKLLAENRQHACLRWIACYSRSGESY